MEDIIQILIGTSALSLLHAAIPHHWFPIVTISRTENWSYGETMLVTVVTGISHTVSTIAIGVVVGLIGYKLSSAHDFITKIAAPSVLVVLGLIYIFLGFKTQNHDHKHHIKNAKAIRKSKLTIVIPLSTAMLLTPCTEIEAYYFTGGALLGWLGIITVSIVYLMVTVFGMIALVHIGYRGLYKLKSNFIEHFEKQIAGVVLVVLGIVMYFVEI